MVKSSQSVPVWKVSPASKICQGVINYTHKFLNSIENSILQKNMFLEI